MSHRSARGLAALMRVLGGLVIAASVLSGCASLEPSRKSPTFALTRDPQASLGRVAASSVPEGDGSGFRPLAFSRYSMDARLSLAANATRSLDVQYYLLQNDSTGRTLLRALRDAAVRGVRVRILVDDLYTVRNEEILQSLAAYPNVEVRLFNPFPAGRAFDATRWAFSLIDFARVNHRMHNKLFIADGALAVAGGRNMADEYFFKSREGNFIDFDLLVAGAAVPRMEALFDVYWNSSRVYALAQIAPFGSDLQSRRDRFEQETATAEPVFPPLATGAQDVFGFHPVGDDVHDGRLRLLYGTIEVFADDPEKVSGKSEAGTDDTTVTSRVLSALESAQKSLLLASPYFVPSENAMQILAGIRARGVSVTLITNSLASNDEPYASVAYSRYRRRMLEMGVDIYEISSKELKANVDAGPMLGTTIGRSHAKVIVIDGTTTFVGSMNMDLRSSRENTEIGMLVSSPELAADVTRLIDSIRATGAYRLRLRPTDSHLQWVATEGKQEIVFDDEPEVDFATRMKAFFFAPLIPTSLL
jgi:cardiolipin synthase C